MKSSIFFFILIIFISLSSCSKDDEAETSEQTVPTPSSFTITPKNISIFSVDIEWTKATVADNSNIKYDIYLQESKIAQDVTSNQYTFDNLESETKYNGKVVAKSSNGKTKEQTFSFTTKSDLTPSSFDISFEIISKSEVEVSWTESTLANGENVKYDLFLYDSYYKEETIINNITELEYYFDSLYWNSEYTLKIVAKSPTDKTTTEEIIFRPHGTPPTDFTLTYEENGPGFVTIFWEPPTVEDESNFIYHVYVNDELYRGYLTSDSVKSTTVSNLLEGVEYNVTIVADASTYNGTETEASINFVTTEFPFPSDFDLSINTLSSTSLYLDWTPSTMPDGSDVIYSLYVNSEQIVNIAYEGYTFDNLLPDTEYTFTIEAKDQHHKTTTKEIVHRTFPIHTSIQVEKAVLYLHGSLNFEKQVNILFTENIENVSITNFHLAKNLNISSFIFYPSAISSSQLSDDEYTLCYIDPYGYVLIRDEGKTYIVDFDIVFESN